MRQAMNEPARSSVASVTAWVLGLLFVAHCGTEPASSSQDSGSSSDTGKDSASVADQGAEVAKADLGPLVPPDVTPPTVKWLAPNAGSVVQLGDAVTLVAQIGDNKTAAAELSVDLTLAVGSGLALPIVKATADGKVTVSTTKLPVGKLTLVLRVLDAEGNSSEANLAVEVNAPPGTPLVAILPTDPTTTDGLQAVIVEAAIDPNRALTAPASYTFQWFRNTIPVPGLIGTQVSSADTAAFDVWQVEVRAWDGMQAGPAVTAAVAIANSKPGAPQVTIEPQTPSVGATLLCKIVQPATDIDAEQTLTYSYSWTLNGQLLPQAPTTTGLELATATTAGWQPLVAATVGDVLGCEVVASDGVQAGPKGGAKATLGIFNPCSSGLSGCGLGADCAPTTTAKPSCTCGKGWAGANGVCTDTDECQPGGLTCASHAGCVNLPGSATCTCNQGYTLDLAGGCTDVDECLAGAVACDLGASCTNTDGAYACPCISGFATGLAGGCTDVDECAQGACGLGNGCTNTVGDFTCACGSGWKEIAGAKCQDVDECATGTAKCDVNATCSNLAGSYQCLCQAGWSGDGKTCADVDECAAGLANCDPNAACANEPGMFLCKCDAGWMGNGLQCIDQDECNLGTAVCDLAASCTNVAGSYQCNCGSGYSGDGKTCADIDECTSGAAQCDAQATCKNEPATWYCQCKTGFIGDGLSCDDIDECAKGGHNCDAAALCANTFGGWTCSCKPGWTGDGKSCLSP